MTEVKRPEAMFPIDLEGAPKILLGGREWSIPLLAHKQNKHVVPALAGIMTALVPAMEAVKSGTPEAVAHAMGVLDEKTYDTLGNAVFWALKRGYPQMGAGEFEEIPISTLELLMALPVVLAQTGFFELAAKGQSREDPTPAAAPSTGTELSSASAAPSLAGAGTT